MPPLICAERGHLTVCGHPGATAFLLKKCVRLLPLKICEVPLGCDVTVYISYVRHAELVKQED